jgi:hypothetical protein
VEAGGQAAPLMGFRKIETMACLIREEKRLKLICECGHSAEPGTTELMRLLYRKRGGFWARLTDLPEHLHCGMCGGKRFRFELLPLS